MSNDVESAERFIPAPAEKIFALLADPAKHQAFDGSGTVREASDSPGRLGLGSTFGMSMRIAMPYTMRNTVVEFEENRRIAWQPRPAYPLVGLLIGGRIWRYELEPRDGGTLVRESWDISQERVKRLVQPMRPLVRTSLPKTLERIEQLVT